jgi:alpha-glucosidase (family GH31 glycosyl hydrolase)
MARLNWTVPVSSLLSRLQDNGYKIFSVNDGAEMQIIDQNLSNRTSRKEATDHICSVDESAVALCKDGKTFAVYIVLGNDPDEIVADYTDNEDLERVIDEFSDNWCDKKCPVILEDDDF